MRKSRAVLFVVALTLTGCNWLSSRSTTANPPGNNGTSAIPPSCACNEFPYPSTCATQCSVADAQIESVNTQARTATIRIVRGTQTIHQTVSLDKLPKGVPVQVGAKFTALLHTGESAEKPRITGVVKLGSKP
jgi:hypothetical protein